MQTIKTEVVSTSELTGSACVVSEACSVVSGACSVALGAEAVSFAASPVVVVASSVVASYIAESAKSEQRNRT